jgi:hypothetical protein
MSKQLKIITGLTLSAVFAYLVAAFILAELDFRLWSVDGRAGLFLAWITFAIFTMIYIFFNDEMDRHESNT